MIFFFFLALFSVEASYPPSWWVLEKNSQLKTWERLPNQVKAPKLVVSLHSPLRVLHPLGSKPFSYGGKRYQSIESFWQSMKFPSHEEDPRHTGSRLKYTREQVMKLSASKARLAGIEAGEKMKRMGINWVSFDSLTFPYRENKRGQHYQLIFMAYLQMLDQNPGVKKLLIETKGLKLVSDTAIEKELPPAWKFWEILMAIRDQKLMTP